LGRTDVIFKKQGRWQNFELYGPRRFQGDQRRTLNLGVRSLISQIPQANDQYTIFQQARLTPRLVRCLQRACFTRRDLGDPWPAGRADAGGQRAIQNNFHLAAVPGWRAWGSHWNRKVGRQGRFGQFYIAPTSRHGRTAGVNPHYSASFTSPNGNGAIPRTTPNKLPACTLERFGSD